MIYLKAFIYAFFCVAGFSVIFNIPRRLIVETSITGALGWVIYYYIETQLGSTILAGFSAALFVGLSGEILARFFKKPATLFVIPGIIPLVPGYGIYYSMLSIVQQNYQEALNTGFESILIAISIASGIIISTSLGKLIHKKPIFLGTRPRKSQDSVDKSS